MTDPQEQTREIDMAKLIQDQAEPATTSPPDDVAGAPVQRNGSEAPSGDAAQ